MPVLLNCIYLLLLLLASPYLIYAAIRHGKYRQGLAAKLWGAAVPVKGLGQGDEKCVWLHAVSVGEVNLLRPLLEKWETKRPDWRFVISTTTKTGYELACKLYGPREVFYCPLDFSWAVRNAVRRIRPDLLVLAELELWPQLIRAVRRRGAAAAIINGRLSDSSFKGYRRIKPLIAGTLKSLNLIAVQNETYAERFIQLGAKASSVLISGSLKFDGAETNRDNPATQRLAKLAGLTDGDRVFLAGSTQHPEEELALETFRRLHKEFPHLKLILTPRHPQRFDEVAALLARSEFSWARRSELGRSRLEEPQMPHLAPTNPQRPPPRILLVDTIGELGAWWGAAHIAFVGGSMGRRGGQNMIEPAALGAAVCFGPNTRNFRQVVSMLLAHGAARVVQSGDELTAFVRNVLRQPESAAKMGARAQKLVAEHQGATERTFHLLEKTLSLNEEAERPNSFNVWRFPKRASLPVAKEPAKLHSYGPDEVQNGQ